MQIIKSGRNILAVSNKHNTSSPFPVATHSWKDKVESVYDINTQPDYKWIKQDDSHQLFAWLPGVSLNNLNLNILGYTLFLGGKSKLKFKDGGFLEYVKIRNILKKLKLSDALNLQDISPLFQGTCRNLF